MDKALEDLDLQCIHILLFNSFGVHDGIEEVGLDVRADPNLINERALLVLALEALGRDEFTLSKLEEVLLPVEEDDVLGPVRLHFKPANVAWRLQVKSKCIG